MSNQGLRIALDDSSECYKEVQSSEVRSTIYVDSLSVNSLSTNKDFGLELNESASSDYGTCHSTGEDDVDGILSGVRNIMSRQRSESAASLDYYRTMDSQLQVSAREELQGHPGGDGPTLERHVHQSRRLPYWLWYIIAKSLGIKLHINDKPILATLLYSLTFMSALGYVMSNWWFTAYDIASEYSKTTVIDGFMSMFFSLLYVALGVYANKLAFRLFSHRKFLDMLRLHSKTILKMNAAAVLFTIMLMIAIVNDYSAFPNFKNKTCENVNVEVIVCKVRYIMRALYSGFAVIWNYLVAFVLISVCRTHVIGIRRFMQTLEQDSRLYESRYMGIGHQVTADRPVLEEYTWVDEDYLDELRDPGLSDGDSNSSALLPQQGRGDSSLSMPAPSRLPARRIPASPHSATIRSSAQSFQSSQDSSSTTADCSAPADKESSPLEDALTNEDRGQTQKDKTASVSSVASTTRSSRIRPAPLLSNSEILFRFWKIQARLRLSSVALQRWTMSILCLVVIWSAMNLVLWLKYEPTLTDLANFFLPVVLLPLLASAYAEVNQEGLRLIKFICPVEERLQLLFVLNNAPLQMTVYGFTLSYATISTAAFGILLAFASKVLLQEISVPRNSTLPYDTKI